LQDERIKVGKFITKHLKKSFLAVLFLSLAASGAVLAAASTTSNGIVTPKDPSASTTMPQRIQQRKNSLASQPSEARKQIIIKNCALAQSGMQDIKTKDKVWAKKRSDTYTSLATQLATTIDHLERQHIDTAKLKAAQSIFAKSINQYLSDSIVYKTAMDDVVVMNCVPDPVGFHATLENARNMRGKLSKDAKAIKNALPDLTKALADAKQVLITKSNSDDGGSNQ
jgi:hypothetical protein